MLGFPREKRCLQVIIGSVGTRQSNKTTDFSVEKQNNDLHLDVAKQEIGFFEVANVFVSIVSF